MGAISQKMPRLSRQLEKVKETVFWDVCDIIIVEYLQNGQGINNTS